MKRYFILLFIVIGSLDMAYSQRMAPRSIALEVGAGVLSATEPGSNHFFSAALEVYAKNGAYQYWGVDYSYREAGYKSGKFPVETYSFEGGYSVRLLSGRRKVASLNAALTGVAGYEVFNRGKVLLDNGAKILNEEGFIYGLAGRLSIDVFLSDHFSLVLYGKAKYFWATTGQALRPGAGMGLRYNF